MITITLGWWLLPLVISIAGLCVSLAMTSGQSSGGFSGMLGFFSFVTYVMFFIVPSLVAWLIWALMK